MRLHALTIRTVLALAGVAGAAPAQTITVDITNSDLVDVGPATTVSGLPGPDGHVSFAEAVIASNNTPGRQTVAFAVPTSEWTYLPGLYPGRAVLYGTLYSKLFTDPVTIDGRTQTAFTGDTNPNGWELLVLGTVYLAGDGSAVLGLDGSSVQVGGSNGLVEGNTGAMGIAIGFSGAGTSGSVVKDNTAGYIDINQSSGNVVVGNTVSRVRVLGWISGGMPASNNRIGGPTPAERNFISGLGTVNSQGIPSGFAVQLFDSIGTVIENNFIGTTPDGMQQGHAYNTTGIWLDAENRGATIRNNLVSGIRAIARPLHGPPYAIGTGIQITGNGSGAAIVGNRIGLNAANEPVLGGVDGIRTYDYYLGPMTNVVIGGTAPGEGNEIAGHDQTGVTLAPSYSGTRITANSIHDNGGIGIDLVTSLFAYGVTPNDPLDPDTGANGLQNFPVLQSANIAGNSIHVVGTLNSSPSSVFLLEFFASPQCDPTGFGEGEGFLGGATVTTNASGDATFDLALRAAVQGGWFVSSTATDVGGSTSEFSACVPVTGSPTEWGTLGMGLAGATGVPQLSGSGMLVVSSPLTFSLSGARPLASVWFVGGLSQVYLPSKGGILVPAPDLVVARTTDAAGAATLTGQLSQALPAGTELTVQAWILDPTAPRRWAVSNAIAAAAP